MAVSLRRPACCSPEVRGGGRASPERQGGCDAWSQNSLESGVGAGQQALHADADPGGLVSQIVIETNEYLELGESLVVGVHAAQRVRHCARGIGDDERITRIGFRLPRIQVGPRRIERPGR